MHIENCFTTGELLNPVWEDDTLLGGLCELDWEQFLWRYVWLIRSSPKSKAFLTPVTTFSESPFVEQKKYKVATN
jgi:hypothetical protein